MLAFCIDFADFLGFCCFFEDGCLLFASTLRFFGVFAAFLLFMTVAEGYVHRDCGFSGFLLRVRE